MLMFGPDECVSKNASVQQVIRTAYGIRWFAGLKPDAYIIESDFGGGSNDHAWF